MKLSCLSASFVLAMTAGLAGAAPIGLIDDFGGTLAAYTPTRILKATGAGNNVYQWEIAGDSLQINTSVYDGIEQFALTRTDVTLGVGEELLADNLGGNLDSQDIGLYVGAGTPTADVRADYVNVYARNNGQVFSRGFDGLTELGLSGGGTPASLESLFVKRLSTDTFELGYYADGGVRSVLATRVISGGNAAGIGSSIGFYADVRGAGIRGNLDNLRIVPEPATAGLIGLALAGAFAARRRG